MYFEVLFLYFDPTQKMASKTEVDRFLLDFKAKLSLWGLLMRSDRVKNLKTLIALEFQVEDVKKELRELSVLHFSEGPLSDILYKSADMWVFGKMIQGKEVYIKVSMGQYGEKVLCISFHFSDYEMKYPYKDK